ncbi:polymeric immunoglobulin receptor-like isoform X2 [Brachyhypopomus gauderio]|uniref:polymeric immunoglobulin receptor-like isoform X2 n=1 Tax=Brachyhypopomus gauderio TaxID=698409 RepID=UPI0040421CEF
MQVCVYLLLVLHAADGCTLDSQKEIKFITAHTGESVLLPCSCTDTHTRPEIFTWKKYNTHRNTWDVISSEREQYRNRVQLGTAHSPGNLSLLISPLIEQDGGQYRCNIKWGKYRDVSLTVKGCTLEQPRGTTDITAHTGESVLLPCSCTEIQAKPERFTWKKYNTYRNTWDVISSESEQYRNRVQLGTAHSPGNLSLLISHLTEEDEGQYRCGLKREEFRNIMLTVKGCTLEHPRQTTIITAHTGESVLLPCSCTEIEAKPERFTWKKYNTKRNTLDVISSESEQYRNRVQLGTAHSPGNLSLLISHLTEEDGGLYRCGLKSGGVRDITLTVKGCTLEHPRQTTTISAHTGDSVLLSCSCTEIQAKPERFTWKKHNTYRNTWDVISSESEQYRNRFQLGTAHSPGNLSLLISHLTEEDGGDYECFLNERENLYIRLTLEGISTTKFTPRSDSTTRSKAPSDPSTTESSERAGTQAEDGLQTSSTKLFYYISVAVGAVVLLLLAVMGVLCWRNKVQKRGQSGLSKEQTVQKTDEETQDCSTVLYSPEQEDLTVLYASVNPKTKRKTAQKEQDDVTYCTVVHSQKTKPVHTPMDDADYTEYASINVKSN